MDTLASEGNACYVDDPRADTLLDQMYTAWDQGDVDTFLNKQYWLYKRTKRSLHNCREQHDFVKEPARLYMRGYVHAVGGGWGTRLPNLKDRYAENKDATFEYEGGSVTLPSLLDTSQLLHSLSGHDQSMASVAGTTFGTYAEFLFNIPAPV